MTKRLFILIVLAGLSGCTALDSIFRAPDAVDSVREEQLPIDANEFVLTDDDVVGELQVVRAREDDTFVDIARTYGLGYDELVQANPGVDPWLPGEGTEILLPTRFVLPRAAREGIVLNIAAKRLFYFPPAIEGGERVVKTYPIGIGREGWSTPTGDTTVTSRARDPVWFVPASIRQEHAEAGDPLPRQVPPGPDNPLGRHVLALGLPGYLIHGTNKPAGVGMRVSHGCIRLYPEDIAWLYERVAIGERVRIVNQPYLFGWANDDLMLEAHPPLLEDERDWSGSLVAQARSSLINRKYPAGSIDEGRLTALAEQVRGFPVSVLNRQPDIDTEKRRARLVTNTIVYDAVMR